MAKISDANKTIAKSAADAFGGDFAVVRYWDDNHKSAVDILTCADCPQDGVASYSTIGLSDHPLYKDGTKLKVRAELVGACASVCSGYPNVLATAAFGVINSRWLACPGAIFPDVFKMYDLSSTMQHVMFAPPFLWEDSLKTLEFEDKTVAWLLVVPISDDEFKYAEERGSDALETLFEKEGIDLFDIERPSVA